METRPRQYSSWDSAMDELDERFSCKASPCRSLADGTLKMDVSKIPIPEDKIKGVYEFSRPKKQKAKKTVTDKPAPTRSRVRPPCNHQWVKHGRESRERGRRRIICKLCKLTETLTPEKRR